MSEPRWKSEWVKPGLLCLLFSLGGYGRHQPHSSAQRRERRQESKPHFIMNEQNKLNLNELMERRNLWFVNGINHEFNLVLWMEHQAEARQAHQLSLLFALPLREAKKKKRAEWEELGRRPTLIKERNERKSRCLQRWGQLFQLSPFNLQWKLKKFSFLWVEWERLLEDIITVC